MLKYIKSPKVSMIYINIPSLTFGDSLNNYGTSHVDHGGTIDGQTGSVLMKC